MAKRNRENGSRRTEEFRGRSARGTAMKASRPMISREFGSPVVQESVGKALAVVDIGKLRGRHGSGNEGV